MHGWLAGLSGAFMGCSNGVVQTVMLRDRIAPMVLLFRFFVIGCFAALASGCVSFPNAPEQITKPALGGNVVQSTDGALLGVQHWPAEEPRAVLLALHGMNDYSNAFALPALWWAENAHIETYALDQRGFGKSPSFGKWVGSETLKEDLRAVVHAIKENHPDIPLYVLGHSMGAAVVMAAEADATLGADGLILAAPGVWGGDALPITHRMAVNIAAIFAPAKTLTGERAARQATDNIDILRVMARDPLVIKQTRIDAVLGVVRIMGEAYGAAEDVCADTLFLMGEKDEIIPLKVMKETAVSICGRTDFIQYEAGWHLLFRDLQAETVWRDIAAWVDQRTAKP